MGDSARGSLHNDTYYGAIERDGEIKYVVRRPINSFEKESDIESIVDPSVREIVRKAIAKKGLKQAVSEDIYMNEEKRIKINKVRCYAKTVKNPINIRKQRDLSQKEYKQQFHVQNESNYILAIYEGLVKGKAKRTYELVKSIEAVEFYKKSTDRADFPSMVPQSKNDLPLRYKLKIGQHVLLYENSALEINLSDIRDIAKRLYVITGLSYLPVGKGFGTIVMRHHQEARMAKDIKTTNGNFKNRDSYRPSIIQLHTQFKALVEGEDFHINSLGEIKPISE
jgi:CRISPR-associated endonuclease Csn1